MSTPEEVAAELAAEQGRPEWLPEQFKSPEDLAKSYDESRREMDRLRSTLDEERAQFTTTLEQMATLQQQPQYQPQPGLDPQTNQLLAQYQAAADSGDAATQLAITLALNQQQVQQEMEKRFSQLNPALAEQQQADRNIAFELASERVAKRYGDQWGEISGEVEGWLREHQSWLPVVNDPAAFEQVIQEGAKIVTNNKAAEQLAALEADRAAKLSAQTASGSGQGRYPIATDEKKAEWEAVKAAGGGSYSDIARS